MTLEEAEALLADVRKAAAEDDDEAAHCAEDILRWRVLEAIADGHPQAPALARVALKSEEIEFMRWCA